jgi:hypothetical protein
MRIFHNIWRLMKKQFFAFLEGHYNRRQRRLHAKALRALRCLGILDEEMKARNVPRSKRRQFWRDVIKDPKASKGAKALLEE